MDKASIIKIGLEAVGVALGLAAVVYAAMKYHRRRPPPSPLLPTHNAPPAHPASYKVALVGILNAVADCIRGSPPPPAAATTTVVIDHNLLVLLSATAASQQPPVRPSLSPPTAAVDLPAGPTPLPSTTADPPLSSTAADPPAGLAIPPSSAAAPPSSSAAADPPAVHQSGLGTPVVALNGYVELSSLGAPRPSPSPPTLASSAPASPAVSRSSSILQIPESFPAGSRPAGGLTRRRAAVSTDD